MKDGFTHDYVIQIVWLFGNLASDSLTMRDAILDSEAYELIVMGIYAKVVPLKDLYIMVWTLANFLRGHPQPSVIVMKRFISLSPLLISYDRDDVLTELL
jgi:Karyopherin (importin) alpha